MPTITYIDCVCCGNQFTNKHGDDPATFVCNSCDDARREALFDDDDER